MVGSNQSISSDQKYTHIRVAGAISLGSCLQEQKVAVRLVWDPGGPHNLISKCFACMVSLLYALIAADWFSALLNLFKVRAECLLNAYSWCPVSVKEKNGLFVARGFGRHFECMPGPCWGRWIWRKWTQLNQVFVVLPLEQIVPRLSPDSSIIRQFILFPRFFWSFQDRFF